MPSTARSLWNRLAPTPRRRAGWVMTVITFALIAAVTLTPGDGPAPIPPLTTIFGGRYGGIDFLLNIVLFVPFGVGLQLALGGRYRPALIASFISLAIELSQIHIVPYRDATLGDWLANSIGALLGVLACASAATWLHPVPRTARRLVVGGMLVWLALITMSAWLLAPAPTDELWYGQWAARLVQFGTFKGTLLTASLDDQPFPSGPFENQAPVQHLMQDGRVSLHATVVTGRRVHTFILAPIASIFNSKHREMMMLAQHGTALVFRARTNTSRLKLREPMVALPHVFPSYFPGKSAPNARDGSRIGDTVQVSGDRLNGIIQLQAQSPRGVQNRTYPLHVLLGWSTVMPFEYALGPEANVLSVLWAVALMFFPGYWLAFRNADTPDMATISIVLLVGLGVIPVVYDLPTSPWWAWIASLAGATLGLSVGRRRKMNTPRE